MDGKIPPEQMKEILELSEEACKKIYDAQKKALKEAVKNE
jgi:ribonuclease PH